MIAAPMIAEFLERFGAAAQPRVYRAPGRVNLIGEHTDYNLGFVLPVALNLATYIAAAPSGDGKLRLYSEDRRELREFDAADLGTIEPAHAWTDYPLGVAQELVRAGVTVEGTNLLIRSTVPDGSGLSSSAALEVSTAAVRTLSTMSCRMRAVWRLCLVRSIAKLSSSRMWSHCCRACCGIWTSRYQTVRS